jgi:hypothetical protein
MPVGARRGRQPAPLLSIVVVPSRPRSSMIHLKRGAIESTVR